ncbi:CLUMA_CG003778, isoform A [Clunio marinus]|uniref:CLUMA_CG003778, isoform A n=1 Tax=Clunio marinus TaxID=568069 RepID=A0A1J1HQ13_9DIPT|nr:CLUMA_CG003778, isoform A [Clunio marinus]
MVMVRKIIFNKQKNINVTLTSTPTTQA